ncbi:MAG: hypothetical protein AAF799_12350 [Myxococcota bacterium]
MSRWLVTSFVGLGLVACGPSTSPTTGDGSGTTATDGGSTQSVPASGSGESQPATSTSAATDTTSPTTAADGASSESTDTEGEVGLGEECTYHFPNCADGLKCVLVPAAENPMAVCVEVVDDPVPSGGACELDPKTGQDNCDATSFCSTFIFNETGYCTDFCEPGDEDAGCADETRECTSSSNGNYGCLPRCNPPDELCPDGHACVLFPLSGSYICTVTNPVTEGQSGDVCYAPSEACSGQCYQCADGTACLDDLDYGPGCDEDLGCCAEYCDVTVGGCSNPLHECIPVPGVDTDLHPNTGQCALPEDFDWCDGTVENPPPGQCPPDDAEPNYPWCSSFDTSACTEGQVILGGGECGHCWCNDSCAAVDECPVPATGVAEVVCDPAVGCSLLCNDDVDCPNGMDCRFHSGELRCLWQPDSCAS